MFGEQRAACYAVDDGGNYVIAPTAGWEPSNFANRQAWEVIREEVELTLENIHAGKASPLALHMVMNQLDPGLLSSYTGIGRFKVRSHLKVRGFVKMSSDDAKKYADFFKIPVEVLAIVPDKVELPGETRD